MQHSMPPRYTNQITVTVPTTDYRTHPSSKAGQEFTIGNGIVHYDVVNIPFYGRVYDTAFIAHPLSMLDQFRYPRPSSKHLHFLLDLLRGIQDQSRNDPRTSDLELAARGDSIGCLIAAIRFSRARCKPPLHSPEAQDQVKKVEELAMSAEVMTKRLEEVVKKAENLVKQANTLGKKAESSVQDEGDKGVSVEFDGSGSVLDKNAHPEVVDTLWFTPVAHHSCCA